jgi:hypothetical protein
MGSVSKGIKDLWGTMCMILKIVVLGVLSRKMGRALGPL